MSLRAGNDFQLITPSVADGTQPVGDVFGTAVTPATGTYGSEATVLAARSDDAFGIWVNVNNVAANAAAHECLVTIVLVDVAEGVDTTDNEIDIADHGLFTGDGPMQWTNSGGSLPTGVSAATDYYVIRRSSGSFALATSRANAFAGTAVDITAAGSGTHTYHLDRIRHLVIGPASLYSNSLGNHGVSFWFPMFIPKNAAIAAKAQRSSGTTNIGVQVKLDQQPTKQYLLRCGTYLMTLGADTANTRGTTITPGTTSEGAYTALGTLSEDGFYIEFGCSISDNAIAARTQHVDIGEGTNPSSPMPRAIVLNHPIVATANENISKHPTYTECEIASGRTVYGRAQHGDSSAETNTSLAAYVMASASRYVPPGAFTVAGTVTIAGSPAANGKDVEIYAVDADGVTELVTTVQTTGGTGAFSASVPDNSRDYFVSYNNDGNYGRSALGTPV
jgi:hypothetical protein